MRDLPAYDETAAQRQWARVLALFERNLAGPTPAMA
ncbi:hypothetical protein [Pseudenhygromyxa sp. WMMC2535]